MAAFFITFLRVQVLILLVCFVQITQAGRKMHRQQMAIRHCPSDMFDDQRPEHGWQNGTLNCRPCSECLQGYGVKTLCTWTEDTQCVLCLEGHYSESIDMWGDCLRCHRCGKNVPVLRACTTTSNTACSNYCPNGYFFSQVGRDCLPCSPCHHQTNNGNRGKVVQACRVAGMNPDMQCWPSHGQPVPDGFPTDNDMTDFDDESSYDNEYKSSSTISQTDPSPSTRQTPSLACNTDHHKDTLIIDNGTAKLYTVILFTLLLVVVLCIILSISVLICLSRLMGRTGHASDRKDKNGYQRISNKTANLLVGDTSHV